MAEEQTVVETRQEFAKRLQEVEQAKRTLREGGAKRRAFTPRAERVAISQYGRNLEKTELELKQQQEAFEKSLIFSTAFQYALPEYVENIYQKTVAEINSKIVKYQKKIDDYERKLDKKNISDASKDRYEAYIDALYAKINVYKKQLKEGKIDVIQKWESDYTEKLSDYYYDRSLGKAPQKEQEQKIKELLKKGYTPQVMEKSFGGKAESTELLFYKPGVGYEKIATIAKGAKAAEMAKFGNISMVLGNISYDFPIHKAEQEIIARKKAYEEAIPQPISTPVVVEQNWFDKFLASPYVNPVLEKFLPKDTTPLTSEEVITATAEAAGKTIDWLGKNIPYMSVFGPIGIPLDIMVSTAEVYVPLPTADGVKYYPYKDVYPGVDKIPMSEFIKIMTEPLTTIKKEQLEIAKKPVDNAYKQEMAARVYGNYKNKLDSGELTFEEAWNLYIQTEDFKNLSKRYSKDVNDRLKETATLGTKFADVALAVADVVPETWGEFAAGSATMLVAPAKIALPIIFSKPIATVASTLYESIPTPTGQVGGFVKGSLFSAGIELFAPAIGIAYGTEIIKGMATKPRETVTGLMEFAVERPDEMAGFLIGGRLTAWGAKQIYAATSPRAAPTTYVTTSKGVIPVTKVPKYGNIAWITGALESSEKIAVARQIFKLTGVKVRIFVQVSSQGIPIQSFAMRKGAGFEVAQTSNPMRGFYENPPMDYLLQLYSQVKTESGALSHYAGASRERGILPDMSGIWDVLSGKGEFSRQRPFEYLRRTGGEIKLPKWIADATQALINNKTIPKTAMLTITKWYNKFMKTSLEYNGKVYLGKLKLDLVNNMNLKGVGSGVKLKYYAALMQYQLENKVQLPSGAENLAMILPYGPEHQLVSAIGTRYFEKPLADLRTSKTLGPVEWLTSKVFGEPLSVSELLLGTKTGEAFSLINNRLVEIQPVRAFPKKGPPPSIINIENPALNLLTDKAGRVVIETTRGGSRSEVGLVGVRYPRPLFYEQEERITMNLTSPLFAYREEPEKERITVSPEPIREEIREEPRRPLTEPFRYESRYPEPALFLYREEPMPRRPEPPRRPEEVTEWLWIPEEERRGKKKEKKKKIKRLPGYFPAPTAFEAVIGTSMKQPRKTKYTGFEPLRFF
jgi:hypothetical protein